MLMQSEKNSFINTLEIKIQSNPKLSTNYNISLLKHRKRIKSEQLHWVPSESGGKKTLYFTYWNNIYAQFAVALEFMILDVMWSTEPSLRKILMVFAWASFTVIKNPLKTLQRIIRCSNKNDVLAYVFHRLLVSLELHIIHQLTSTYLTVLNLFNSLSSLN